MLPDIDYFFFFKMLSRVLGRKVGLECFQAEGSLKPQFSMCVVLALPAGLLNKSSACFERIPMIHSETIRKKR